MVNVVLTSLVENPIPIEEDRDGTKIANPDYDSSPLAESGEVVRYQCSHCGYVLLDVSGSEITELTSLANWLTDPETRGKDDEQADD